MMTQQDYLLVQLAEEAAEVIHRVSKALRFGLDEVQDGQTETNLVRLLGELNDLAAVADLIEPMWIDEQLINAKKVKVAKYMRYSEGLGKVKGGEHQ